MTHFPLHRNAAHCLVRLERSSYFRTLSRCPPLQVAICNPIHHPSHLIYLSLWELPGALYLHHGEHFVQYPPLFTVRNYKLRTIFILNLWIHSCELSFSLPHNRYAPNKMFVEWIIAEIFSWKHWPKDKVIIGSSYSSLKAIQFNSIQTNLIQLHSTGI